MKTKINLEKFICSMLNDSKTNAGYVHAKSIERALKEQGMEYKDGEIVEVEQEDLRKRYERIGKSDWFKKNHEGMSITIPTDLKGTDPDGGVVGEKGEQGEAPFKEHMENLKKRIEDNQLGCIVQRLDKIIELLQEAILVIPKETFGSDYDIDTDKMK